MLKLPDGTVKVLVEGQQRADVNQIEEGESHFTASVTPVAVEAQEPAGQSSSEVEALRRALMQQFVWRKSVRLMNRDDHPLAL